MRASRKIWIGAAVVAALVVIGGYALARSVTPLLELGTGYGARVACGCRYIGNRTLAQCHADFEPGMEAISLSEDAATRTITASVPLIASRSVRYDPVLGCQPEPFRGSRYIVHGK